jgi:hypothetical protein
MATSSTSDTLGHCPSNSVSAFLVNLRNQYVLDFSAHWPLRDLILLFIFALTASGGEYEHVVLSTD